MSDEAPARNPTSNPEEDDWEKVSEGEHALGTTKLTVLRI